MTQIKTAMMVLFLLCLTSFTLEKNLSKQGTDFYIIRSEWDNRCLNLVNGQTILGIALRVKPSGFSLLVVN